MPGEGATAISWSGARSRRSTCLEHPPRHSASTIEATYADFDAGRARGFLRTKGAYTPIDFPGAQATNAYDINAGGEIVGIYADAGGTIRGYVRGRHGDYTGIDVPGATLTFPFGINNRGQVVGFYLDADLVRHGFQFEDGVLTRIDHPLAAADTQAHDINDRGQIVGLYERGASNRNLESSPVATANGTLSNMVERWGRGGNRWPVGPR